MEIVILILTAFILYFFTRIFRKKVSASNFSTPKEVNYTMIETPKSLADLVENIITKKIYIIGVDTEYYKGDHYNGQLCIIQISIPNGSLTDVFIVDLLKIDKNSLTTNFMQLFTNEEIEKVFHCCDNDIEWIYEEFQIKVCNVFDTQEVYKVIYGNKKQKGLNDLLNEFFSLGLIKEHKKFFQKSNWSVRPLSEDQLKYAAMDSFYLIKLRNILREGLGSRLELYKKNSEEKINKKFSFRNRIERIEHRGLNFLTSNMTKSELIERKNVEYVFIQILRLNEEFAKENNINADWLLSVKFIYKISTRLPKTKEEFAKLVKTSLTIVNESLTENFLNFIFERYEAIIQNIQEIEENYPAESPLHLHSQTNQFKKEPHELKQERKDKVKDWISCKRPVYENCMMLAPDGELLCYCDSKKMNWYLEKNLGVLLNKESPQFKLLFEPNARGGHPDDLSSHFYLKHRVNLCVVCGQDDNYMRFHIVPVLYRKFFPLGYKSHNSHDIVLLCLDCHEKANKLYSSQKEVLSLKYNVPLNSQSEDLKNSKSLQEHISIARVLVTNFSSMPLERKEELQKEMCDFIQSNLNNENCVDYFEEVYHKKKMQIPNCVEELSFGILEGIKSYKLKNSNQKVNKSLHGKFIVEGIKDFHNFIKDWRLFFVSSLKPKFLPENWDINHDFYSNVQRQSKFFKN